MKKIGLISDTHAYLEEKVFDHFSDCDEIWHAGDFGTLEVAKKLQALKPLRGVFGNIDSKEIRMEFPEKILFEVEGFKVLIIHIAGIPPNYTPAVKALINSENPDIIICGHSHILRVLSDKTRKKLLYINPGAEGKQGFHKIRTIMKFDLNKKKIENMKVIELGKRGEI